jgi:hypothetical protein
MAEKLWYLPPTPAEKIRKIPKPFDNLVSMQDDNLGLLLPNKRLPSSSSPPSINVHASIFVGEIMAINAEKNLSSHTRSFSCVCCRFSSRSKRTFLPYLFLIRHQPWHLNQPYHKPKLLPFVQLSSCSFFNAICELCAEVVQVVSSRNAPTICENRSARTDRV